MTRLESSSKSLSNRILISMSQTLSEKKMKGKQGLTCFTLKDRKTEEQSL